MNIQIKYHDMQCVPEAKGRSVQVDLDLAFCCAGMFQNRAGIYHVFYQACYILFI